MISVEKRYADKLIELMNLVVSAMPQELQNNILELALQLEHRQCDEQVLMAIYASLSEIKKK